MTDNKEDESTESFMRQKLMSADECYVYKIPPLKDSGGHRAEDWNLANPLQTCSMVVERRGDQLVLEFYVDSGKTLFAQSILDCANSGKPTRHWLEPVVDSSRYFTLKITGQGGREALIGFGFRDRDQAIDLREGVQHYENSIQREREAADIVKNAPKYIIPKLAEGEKIHINTGRERSSKPKKDVPKSDNSTEGGKKIIPLLKKPPPSPESASKQQQQKEHVISTMDQKEIVQKLTLDLGDVQIDSKSNNRSSNDEGGDDDNDDDDSGGAVYDGNDEQWAEEFETK